MKHLFMIFILLGRVLASSGFLSRSVCDCDWLLLCDCYKSFLTSLSFKVRLEKKKFVLSNTVFKYQSYKFTLLQTVMSHDTTY